MEITKRSERSWGKCLTGWGAGGRWNPVGAGRRQGVITNQGCSSPGKELCYWFLSVGHQHLLLTTSFYLLWVSVHFNKQEFICRLGVWLGSQVRFLSKGLFVCVPYNIVFKLFKFNVSFPLHFKPSGLEGGRGNSSSLIWKVIVMGKYWLWESLAVTHTGKVKG